MPPGSGSASAVEASIVYSSMRRKAYGASHKSFLNVAVPDVENLIKLHAKETGSKKGKRSPKIQVVSRSAVVLACASWEAFCEDLAAEVLNHLADYVPTGQNPPAPVMANLKPEMAVGRGLQQAWGNDAEWRRILRACASKLTDGDDQTLNTPKTSSVRKLFKQYAGIDDITLSWFWQGTNSASAATRLDDFADLRCKIAHRRAPNRAVYKNTAKANLNLAVCLAHCTAEEVAKLLSNWTNVTVPIWDLT